MVELLKQNRDFVAHFFEFRVEMAFYHLYHNSKNMHLLHKLRMLENQRKKLHQKSHQTNIRSQLNLKDTPNLEHNYNRNPRTK